MLKIVCGIVIAGTLLIGGYTAWRYVQHKKELTAQINLAYRAVATTRDYSGSSSFLLADLTARERLDELELENLNSRELECVASIREWLNSIEGLASSHSLETSQIRSKIEQEDFLKAQAKISEFIKKP